MAKREYTSTDRHGNVTTTTLDRYDFNSVYLTITRHDPDGKHIGMPRSSIVPMDWLREAVGEI